MMLIIRKDPMNGQLNRLYLDITDKEYQDWLSGTNAKRAFPRLNADLREYIVSGIPPGKWEEYVGNDKYEEVDV